ncbi:TetR/AcrR family transcriptional regulator [Streptomyces olivochromogenes]|uniref:TetR/AcrR family transcriptional regulator n=1 Tax=Streptomyces olivochromogenes TaxID=1963 RepID=UPI001F1A3F17|nr:TetR/AcrR family transcriptional regulator [Streptomyces olivochromogenes]MCF3134690.1 TetR/AcrR family transcriptional regulator [Streptomyces olivochromogenes]
MEREEAEQRALDAAEELFYGQGIRAVGMDAIRSASAVPLKRLYQLFPSKDSLIEAYLRRRDARWLSDLAQYVETADSPTQRILAVFDWLYAWFSEPDFRGCGFINSFGEMGATSPAVADIAKAHKQAFRQFVADLVAAAEAPNWLTDHLVLLAEGAMTTAAIHGSPESARQAKDAARTLLQASRAGADIPA